MHEEKEWTLADIASVLARGHRGILLVAAVVTIAVLTKALLEPAWLVKGTVQIAQLGHVGQTVAAAAQLVEPPQRAIERLKLKRFQNAVLTRVGLPVSESNETASVFSKSFVARIVTDTELIQISVLWQSAEEGKRLLLATVDELAAAHAEMAKPSIERIRFQLDLANRGIEDARRDLADHKALSAAKEFVPGQFSERVYLATLINSDQMRLHEFEQRRSDYEEQLSSLRTYGTSLLQPPYAERRRAVVTQTLLGLVGGLALGVLLAFSLEMFRALRSAADTAAA